MMTEADQNQRAFDRTSVRASATLWVPDAQGNFKTIRAWTDDVSASGANILTAGPVGESLFSIRISIPGMDEQLLDCVCVRKGQTQVRTLSNLKEITRYNYGVKFMGVSTNPVLLAAVTSD